jgi:D-glycero-D-manno-heptose 1,7-bisphosphate phosphatase
MTNISLHKSPPMKNLFLDRDGIINNVVMRNGKVCSPRHIGEFKVRQEFINFYGKIKDIGINLFVVSNQPDIARNLMSQYVLENINTKLLSQFTLKEICYCTHDDKDLCKCRKPKPGLITNLLNKHNLLKEESLLIGDSHKDILAGQAAGIKTIFLATNYNTDSPCSPDFSFSSLHNIIHLLI